MLNYNERMNKAWEQIPQHRQKEILDELEHKAYQQDFSRGIKEVEPIKWTTDSEGNIMEPIADLIYTGLKGIKWLVKDIIETFSK